MTSQFPKTCALCPQSPIKTYDSWLRLPWVGAMSDGADGELELRNHSCGSTLAVQTRRAAR
jgi:hypothetical protein